MFKKLSNLLVERAGEREVLQEASHIQKMQILWEKKGTFLFPENIQDHMLLNVRVQRVQRQKIILEAKDPHTKNALMLRQKELLKLFQGENENLQTIHLTFPQ